MQTTDNINELVLKICLNLDKFCESSHLIINLKFETHYERKKVKVFAINVSSVFERRIHSGPALASKLVQFLSPIAMKFISFYQ